MNYLELQILNTRGKKQVILLSNQLSFFPRFQFVMVCYKQSIMLELPEYISSQCYKQVLISIN